MMGHRAAAGISASLSAVLFLLFSAVPSDAASAGASAAFVARGVLPASVPSVPPTAARPLVNAATRVGGRLLASNDDDNDGGGTVKEDMNPLTRASWYAVEAFGKAFGRVRGSIDDGGGDGDGGATSSSEAAVDLSLPPSSLAEALRRIRLDNDRSYFLSGDVDSLAYDERCVFSDPFVSFEGRDRFVDNLANLGSFITEYDARMLGYEVSEDGATVETKVMVKLELNLPWKPVLAWTWGVKYDIDPETFLITSHAESWDIEPWEGVKQIFRKPTTSISKK